MLPLRPRVDRGRRLACQTRFCRSLPIAYGGVKSSCPLSRSGNSSSVSDGGSNGYRRRASKLQGQVADAVAPNLTFCTIRRTSPRGTDRTSSEDLLIWNGSPAHSSSHPKRRTSCPGGTTSSHQSVSLFLRRHSAMVTFWSCNIYLTRRRPDR